jgi:hypothetical protein
MQQAIRKFYDSYFGNLPIREREIDKSGQVIFERDKQAQHCMNLIQSELEIEVKVKRNFLQVTFDHL